MESRSLEVGDGIDRRAPCETAAWQHRRHATLTAGNRWWLPWNRWPGTSSTSDPVWSKISNTLKRLGFQSHNFLAQLLSETSRACTIRVRRSTLGRLWNELGSHAGLHHRHRRSRAAVEKRISGCGEPYPESPDQGPAAPVGS